jgi:integrase
MSDQEDHVIKIARREPWNKGRLIGQKRPLRPKDVSGIRVRLQIGGLARDLALFNLAVDSKLRACDLVALRTSDIEVGGRIRERATVEQKKTFETGWQPWFVGLMDISSPAGSEEARICLPDSTHAS